MKVVKYVARLLQALQSVLKHWTRKFTLYTLQFNVIGVVDVNTHNRKESLWFLKREGTHLMPITIPLNFMKYTCVFKMFSTFSIFEILFMKLNYHLICPLVVTNQFKGRRKIVQINNYL